MSRAGRSHWFPTEQATTLLRKIDSKLVRTSALAQWRTSRQSGGRVVVEMRRFNGDYIKAFDSFGEPIRDRIDIAGATPLSCNAQATSFLRSSGDPLDEAPGGRDAFVFPHVPVCGSPAIREVNAENRQGGCAPPLHRRTDLRCAGHPNNSSISLRAARWTSEDSGAGERRSVL